MIVCTDGLSNIGIGSLDLIDEGKIKFYDQLAETARHRNIAISVMAIKGEGCKMEVIGKLAAATNGNVKVVNPEKLAVDFATVLKDEVVGLEVVVKVMLHKAMTFRNEDEANLRDSRTVLIRNFANATVNTKVSF